ncbi:MAG: prenyltransferase/squalene oxidase repeat-containing protein [Polyangiales bacterium]
MSDGGAPDDLAARVDDALARACDALARAQDDDGSWAGDYGGPMFLLPMYVIVARFAGHALDPSRAHDIARYLRHAQNADGAVGVYEGGPGCLFTSALTYTALRFVGVPGDDPDAARLAAWVRAMGTPRRAASWGKFVLSLVDLYPRSGLSPLTPELWLLPYAFPAHPARLWCHARQVYLPMAWLYGRHARRPADALVREVRAALYGADDPPADAAADRLEVAPCDAYAPVTPALRVVDAALAAWERVCPNSLRRRALDVLWAHLRYEDEVTSYLRIGPVNAVLNTACHAVHDPGGEGVRRSFEALEAYLWQGPHGLSMQGYNSSRLWDTAFAAQALHAAGAAGPALTRALTYVRDHQIVDELPARAAHHRDPSRGAWPFSNRAHGWPITDCTAEGLKCALLAESLGAPHPPEALLHEAVERLLGWQNDDGGWGTYERQRAGRWLEALNPSQVFGDIMVDGSFTECTSAVMQALVNARARFPGRYERAIARALSRGSRYLRDAQRRDGSWEGAWGVCFTYGTWFGVSGLRASGAGVDDPALRRACAFLAERQRADGGWGEHPASCWERRYIDHPEGQVVMTAWAMLALLRAGHDDRACLARAARFLVDRQGDDGVWPEESIAGVFNRTCMIKYDNYRRYFPTWALAEWRASRDARPTRR